MPGPLHLSLQTMKKNFSLYSMCNSYLSCLVFVVLVPIHDRVVKWAKRSYRLESAQIALSTFRWINLSAVHGKLDVPSLSDVGILTGSRNIANSADSWSMNFLIPTHCSSVWIYSGVTKLLTAFTPLSLLDMIIVFVTYLLTYLLTVSTRRPSPPRLSLNKIKLLYYGQYFYCHCRLLRVVRVFSEAGDTSAVLTRNLPFLFR